MTLDTGAVVKAAPVNVDGEGARTTLSLRPERVTIKWPTQVPKLLPEPVPGTGPTPCSVLVRHVPLAQSVPGASGAGAAAGGAAFWSAAATGAGKPSTSTASAGGCATGCCRGAGGTSGGIS